jgi:WD40 repeat protein
MEPESRSGGTAVVVQEKRERVSHPLWLHRKPHAVVIRSADSGEVLRAFEIPQVSDISLSPLGTYLLSYTRLPEADDAKADGQREGNLVVWDVKTGEAIGKFLQKSGWSFCSFEAFSSDSEMWLCSAGGSVAVHPMDRRRGHRRTSCDERNSLLDGRVSQRKRCQEVPRGERRRLLACPWAWDVPLRCFHRREERIPCGGEALQISRQ